MKIGILGGTFNPIHLGHIRLAEEARSLLKLDKVIFVPAYLPPHKLASKDILPFKERLEMVRVAIEKMPGIELSDIEGRLKGASYSINTIKEFKRVYGEEAEIFFITGSDSLEELNGWREIGELKKMCRFVIATRPGYPVKSKPKGTLIIDVDTPDISSTRIRRLIREKAGFKEALPIKVYDYIVEKKLYL